jgi:hypothetical protein
MWISPLYVFGALPAAAEADCGGGMSFSSIAAIANPLRMRAARQ